MRWKCRLKKKSVDVVESDKRWVGGNDKDVGNRVTYNMAGQYFHEYIHNQYIRFLRK